jgi:putative two-component system response regulator
MIPFGARIVAVADVYDALTTDRPYRARIAHPDALAHLEEQAGRTLDGSLVRLFAELFADGLTPQDGGEHVARERDDAAPDLPV